MKKEIAIIGAGPSALMLACELNPEKFSVTIYERNAAPGRKFLVAGKGGFNLTHSENIDEFKKKYTPSKFLINALDNFSNTDLRTWLKEKEIETYVGTSKRVFPVKGIKPIQVLNVFENELKRRNVSVQTNHKWIGWNENNELIFETKDTTKIVKADTVVFALGGGSWKVTGTDGGWLNLFSEKGIECSPFIPSNCAYKVDWKNAVNGVEGEALKNCSFSVNDVIKKGEAVLTKFGIEGGAIYALSKEIRERLLSNKNAVLQIDFKPETEIAKIIQLLSEKGKHTVKDILSEKLKLSAAQISLLKNMTIKEEYNDPATLARLIKNFPINLTDFAPVDEAISTVGGINLHEVDKNYQLIKLPYQYCIGEMLDW
ncbi:MAG: TIGR03862 family flavoprotein, partial [Bacteroidia bacterium]|nr:TIGR03862 family flavoprotein [Bacteroidia bacterium]